MLLPYVAPVVAVTFVWRTILVSLCQGRMADPGTDASAKFHTRERVGLK
jgi:hypothetical protein